MKVKGIADIVNKLVKIRDTDIQNKIDNIDWEKNEDKASEMDDRLNDVWMILNDVVSQLDDIKDI